MPLPWAISHIVSAVTSTPSRVNVMVGCRVLQHTHHFVGTGTARGALPALSHGQIRCRTAGRYAYGSSLCQQTMLARFPKCPVSS